MKKEQKDFLTIKNYIQNKEKVFINKVKVHTEQNLHAHNFIEIAYVSQGKGIHRIGKKDYPVSKGDLFLIDYNEEHVFLPVANSHNLIVYNCIFQPEFIDNSLVNYKEFTSIMHHFLFCSLFPEENEKTKDIKIIGKDSDAIEGIYEKMYREYINKELGYLDILRAYIIELVVLIFRLYKKEEQDKDPIEIERIRLIERTISFMEKNFNQ